MAENRRGKENRFYFSRGQMVLLGVAFTSAAVIIFVLGIFVGKMIEGRKLVNKEEPLVRIPVKPGAPQSSAVPVPQAKDEITFNDSPAKPAASVASTQEKAGEASTAEKVTKLEKKQNGAKTEARAVKANEVKEVKSPPAEAAPKKAEPAEPPEQKDQPRLWRAQVNAFPDERSAKQVVDRLKNKGYNAYVTEVQNRGKSWFRVSVGRYNSREEADKMVEVLRSKENFPKAFAASR
jgi:cell division protein FtsN